MSTLPAQRQPTQAPAKTVTLIECAVCGIEAPSREMADCADCGAVFHIDLSREALGRSCGAAMFGQACGFSFSVRPLHRAQRGQRRRGRTLALGRPLAAAGAATHEEAREP